MRQPPDPDSPIAHRTWRPWGRTLLVAGIGCAAGLVASSYYPLTGTSPVATTSNAAAVPKNVSAGAGTPASPAKRPPVSVETAVAKGLTLTDTITAIGSLVAQESAEVTADSSGRIVSVSAPEGLPVKRGDELFRLDGVILAAEVADAEARMALAETSFRRNQTLARSQTVAQSQVEQSRAELEQARSALDLARERQRRLIIRAPFDGYLGIRAVSEGAYVNAGMPLIRIDQISSLKVSISVPERFYGAISVGQTVDLTADAVPGAAFKAKISAINPVIDTGGRAMQILATLDNSGLALRPGMLVRAKVIGAARETVTVPESVIVPQGQDTAVFVVRDGKAERQVVKTGLRREGWVEIRTGLAAGEVIVAAGGTRLSDGAPVQISPKAQAQ